VRQESSDVLIHLSSLPWPCQELFLPKFC
jgi:hypothetical protein